MKCGLKFNLNYLFLMVLIIGVITLLPVSYALLKMERDNAVKRWQMDMVQQSSAATSSYYASLITKMVLGLRDDVERILRTNKAGENLNSIGIVPQSDISMRVLETCEVNQSQSFFHQVPACYEVRNDNLVIYHELRSVGYNLGYLRKEVPLPSLGLLNNRYIALNMAIIVVCFIFINAITLFMLKRYVIGPIKRLIASLGVRKKPAVTDQTYKISELQLLSSEMSKAFVSISEYQSKVDRLEYEARLGEMASQVAHDVRSPLAALTSCTHDLSELSEDKRVLIRSAILRIEDIANDLADKKQTGKSSTDDSLSLLLLSGLVESLISEKRMQYRQKPEITISAKINKDSYGLFVLVRSGAIKRVLSNVISNSVEAIQGRGSVEVCISGDDERIFIVIQDNGRGMPAHILPKLGQKGATFNKSHGSGLGLYHAKQTLSGFNGRLEIESVEHVGTKVTISLPRVKPPDWFVPFVKVSSNYTVVIMDDDPSIHHVWQGRLESCSDRGLLDIRHFMKAEEMIDWFWKRAENEDNTLFLVDQELLGSQLSGLDLIESLHIARSSILVTSRYEDQDVKERCKSLGVRIIPKGLAGFVPIRVDSDACGENMPVELDYVLIDDDDLVRQNWKIHARKAGKRIRIYEDPTSFLEEASEIDTDVEVYIDSNLGNGIKGEDISVKVAELGFENIFIATGFDAEMLRMSSVIKGVVGKEPPWLS